MQKPTLDPSHSVKSLSDAQGDLSGTIEFKGVHFSYPSRPDFKVMLISIHANGATLLCTHSDLHTDRYSGNGGLQLECEGRTNHCLGRTKWKWKINNNPAVIEDL